MAVSKEFLAHLDKIQMGRNFEMYEVDHLLHELKYNWVYLQNKYPIYVRGFDTYVESIQHVLFEMAEIGYELLYHFLDYSQTFDNIILAAKELHITKNAGYSGTVEDPTLLGRIKEVFGKLFNPEDSFRNFRMCEQFGISAADGCLVRLCDKYGRFWNVYLNSENDKVGESAVDTMRDFCAYCLILHILIEEGK